MGLDPGGVGFLPENAFSLGFARDVHVARLGGGDGDTEVFAVVAANPAAARALAAEFTRGLLEYGNQSGVEGGITWIADRYLATIAGVTTRDRFVTGVRGASDRKAARAALDRLHAALSALPAPILARASVAAPATASGDGAEMGYAGGEPAGRGGAADGGRAGTEVRQ